MQTLEFDGAHLSYGSGVGIVLTTPSKDTFYYSYILEYHCTNNVSEYEDLVLGLNLAIDRGVTHPKSNRGLDHDSVTSVTRLCC
jgi:ribonuclease HI